MDVGNSEGSEDSTVRPSDGADVGFPEGWEEEGRSDGTTLAEDVGNREGSEDRSLWPSDGAEVGLEEACAEGFSDGNVLRNEVGRAEGRSDGNMLGLEEGGGSEGWMLIEG